MASVNSQSSWRSSTENHNCENGGTTDGVETDIVENGNNNKNNVNSDPPVGEPHQQQTFYPQGMGAPGHYHQYNGGSQTPFLMRNNSPFMRPESSASTSSAASHHTAHTGNVSGQQPYPNAVPRYQNGNVTSHQQVGSLSTHHLGQNHHSHPQYPLNPHGPPGILIRPTGRYPMLPRSARGGFHARPCGMPSSFQHHSSHQYPGNMPPNHEYNLSHYHHEAKPRSVSVPPPPPPPLSEKEKRTEDDSTEVDHNMGGNATENQNAFAATNFDHVNQSLDPKTGADAKRPVSETQEAGQSDEAHHQHNQQYPSSYEVGPGMQYSGYLREQNHHYCYNAQQTYYAHHHGYNYGQPHGNSHGMRYGNHHNHHPGTGAVSPPPYHPANPYHPSEYHLGPTVQQNHSGYEQSYHNRQGYAPPPPSQTGFQLPQYTARRGSLDPSLETTVEVEGPSRSPSPPPLPPVGASEVQQHPIETMGQDTHQIQQTDHSKTSALGERDHNDNIKQSVTADESEAKPAAKKEDATVDAASILLQLGATVQNAGDAENENPHIGPNLLPLKHPVPQSVQGSISMDEASEVTHPDLASDPSLDSVDHSHRIQPSAIDSDFPCKIPTKYPTRLCLPYDGAKLNSLHCFLRSDLLEIFVVQKSPYKSPTHSPHSSIGRVGLRCVHCALNHRNQDRDEAPMAVFYPKSVAEIYRLVTSWQRCHLRKCRNLPPAVRTKWMELRETDKSRGKTHYWVTSAKEIGLRDCQSRAGGIRFAPDLDGSQLPPQTRPVSHIPQITLRAVKKPSLIPVKTSHQLPTHSRPKQYVLHSTLVTATKPPMNTTSIKETDSPPKPTDDTAKDQYSGDPPDSKAGGTPQIKATTVTSHQSIAIL